MLPTRVSHRAGSRFLHQTRPCFPLLPLAAAFNTILSNDTPSGSGSPFLRLLSLVSPPLPCYLGVVSAGPLSPPWRSRAASPLLAPVPDDSLCSCD